MAGPGREGTLQRVAEGEPERGPADRHTAGCRDCRSCPLRGVAPASELRATHSQGAPPCRVAASRDPGPLAPPVAVVTTKSFSQNSSAGAAEPAGEQARAPRRIGLSRGPHQPGMRWGSELLRGCGQLLLSVLHLVLRSPSEARTILQQSYLPAPSSGSFVRNGFRFMSFTHDVSSPNGVPLAMKSPMSLG